MELAAPVAIEARGAVAVEAGETRPAEEPAAFEVEPVAAPVSWDPEAMAVEIEAAPTPVAEKQPEMFHVEPVRTPRSRARRAVSLDKVELAALRERLVAEEGASDVVMTLHARLAGRAPDRAVARLLGEAYLRLGDPSAAAAHFRQAMLHRVRERTETVASQPR